MTGLSRARLGPSSWLRLPRRTARLRFTLLSGALFLLAGAALLIVTYLLFEQGTGAQHSAGGPAQGGAGPVGGTTRGIGLQLPGTNQTLGAARQAASAAQLAADRHELLVSLAIALPIVAALALLLGWFFAGRMLRPVRTITSTARRISASNLNQRLALDDADEEFKDLGNTLDDLFSRLEASFEAQRHFVANASHELRTPLTLEQALLDAALTDPDPNAESWRDACERALAASRQQGRLIDALLTLARSEGGLDHRERIDLSVICDDVLLRPDIDTLGLHIETTIRPAHLDGDPRLIERLIGNLVDNAIAHNLFGGHVQVATAVTNGRATLSVTNTGPVIPPAEIGRLFRPFQRLDPHRTHHNDGHGLGLSIVAAIAAAHGASITAHPAPEGGLSIIVTFPPPTANVTGGDEPPTKGHGAPVAGRAASSHRTVTCTTYNVTSSEHLAARERHTES
jgi:signal transduction histidine kinase